MSTDTIPPAPVEVPAAILDRIAAAGILSDRAGSFPTEGIAAVHAASLLHATVARRYGGPGGKSRYAGRSYQPDRPR